MTRPRVVFATMAAGGSHVASATAMRQAVEREAPGRFEMDIREILPEFGFEEFDAAHKKNWRWMLQHPGYASLGRRFIDLAPRTSQWINRRFIVRDFAAEAARRLKNEAPALVVVNHPLLAIGLAEAQRQHGLETPVMTFQTTTLDTTSLWAVHDAQRIVLGSEVARDLMAGMGVPEEIMDVVGYPVREGFLQRPSRSRAREALGLEPDRFSVLVSLGGEGVGVDAVAVARALLDEGIGVIVIAGRNPQLRARVSALGDDPSRLRVEGFVDNMWDYMAAADIVVGKTGPASVMEALSCECPIVAPARSGPNERAILDWLVAKELGVHGPTPSVVAALVSRYREDAELLAATREKARAYDFPAMASRIGRYIVHFAQTGTPDPTLCGPGVS